MKKYSSENSNNPGSIHQDQSFSGDLNASDVNHHAQAQKPSLIVSARNIKVPSPKQISKEDNTTKPARGITPDNGALLQQVYDKPTPYNDEIDFLTAALWWFTFGFRIIPLIPNTKQPAVKWDPWLKDLSPEKIKDYWKKHPDHELGFIVGDDIIVFDADSPMAIAALYEIEEAFDIPPNLIVSTTKGEHHYFRRAPSTYAKNDSHSTEKHPERIDVKTGRALVVLPPSTGKEVKDD